MTQVGDRIELVRTDDPYTKLRHGSKGTVVRVIVRSGVEEISVDWDDGSYLRLIEDVGDQWAVISEFERERAQVEAERLERDDDYNVFEENQIFLDNEGGE